MSNAVPFEMPDELDDVLMGAEPPWDDEPEPPPDATRADQMVYRLRGVTLSRTRDQKVAAARAQQVAEWLDRREAAYDRQEAWLRAALRRYHEAVLLLDPKRLSIALPSGTLASRQGQREWAVDEAAVLGWAFPPPASAALDELRGQFQSRLAWIVSNLSVQADAVKLPTLTAVSVAKAGLKELGTRRDEKGKAIGWGVDPDGAAIPGVTIIEPERSFSVVFPEELAENVPPETGGLTVEDAR